MANWRSEWQRSPQTGLVLFISFLRRGKHTDLGEGGQRAPLVFFLGAWERRAKHYTRAIHSLRACGSSSSWARSSPPHIAAAQQQARRPSADGWLVGEKNFFFCHTGRFMDVERVFDTNKKTNYIPHLEIARRIY